MDIREVAEGVVDVEGAGRVPGRGGSGGFAEGDTGACGGRGSEEVYAGRVNVGYDAEEDERARGNAGIVAKAPGRVEGPRRSWKILEDGCMVERNVNVSLRYRGKFSSPSH